MKGQQQSRMISLSIRLTQSNLFFSSEKPLKTPMDEGRYNAIFVMTAAHHQDEVWGGKHALRGFPATESTEEAISFRDFVSANCSVVTFLWAVLHSMYISEVKHNETLNGNHFRTTGSCITENNNKKRLCNLQFLWYSTEDWKMIRNGIFHPRQLCPTSKRLIFCMNNAHPSNYRASKIGELLFCPFNRQLWGFKDMFHRIKWKNSNICQFASINLEYLRERGRGQHWVC